MATRLDWEFDEVPIPGWRRIAPDEPITNSCSWFHPLWRNKVKIGEISGFHVGSTMQDMWNKRKKYHNDPDAFGVKPWAIYTPDENYVPPPKRIPINPARAQPLPLP